MKKSIFNLLAFLFGFLSYSYADQGPNVTIFGKTYNKFTAGVMLYDNPVKLGKPIFYSLSINPDSTFEVRFYLPKPSEIMFDNVDFFCKPGDTVHVVVKGADMIPSLKFTGFHSSIYNFMADLYQFNQQNRIPNFVFDIRTGKIKVSSALEIVKNRYKKKLRLYQDFCIKNNPSIEIKKYIYSKIYFEYLTLLQAVIHESGKQSEYLKKKYFGPLKASTLENDFYCYSRSYFNTLVSLIEDFWVHPGSGEPLAQLFLRQFKFIKQNFSGKTRDGLSSLFFVNFVNRGDFSYAIYLGNIYFDDYYFSDKNYKKTLLPFYEQYKSLQADWTKDSTQLIQANGHPSTLANIINENSGKVLYIDIWASWCGPCRAEFPNSKHLEVLYKNKDIKFLYLSLDANQSDWMKANVSENLSYNLSFWIKNNSVAQFKSKLNLVSIPHYLIFDKTGRLKIADAVRPGDKDLPKILDQLLLE